MLAGVAGRARRDAGSSSSSVYSQPGVGRSQGSAAAAKMHITHAQGLGCAALCCVGGSLLAGAPLEVCAVLCVVGVCAVLCVVGVCAVLCCAVLAGLV